MSDFLLPLGDDMVNAAVFPGANVPTQLNNAISAASAAGKHMVWIPKSMLPYAAASVSFNSTIQMVREGQNMEHIDVLAYGAFSDGNGTPCTTAINSAISCAAKSTSLGGFFATIGIPSSTVYLPGGEYQLDGPIVLPNRVRLMGSGIRGTSITPKSNFGSNNSMTAMIMNASNIQQHVWIEHLELNGFNGMGTSQNAINGILLDGCGQTSYIRDVELSHFGSVTTAGYAIKLLNTGVGQTGVQSGLLLENLNVFDVTDDAIQVPSQLRLMFHKICMIDCGFAGKAGIKGLFVDGTYMDHITFETTSNATQRYGVWLLSGSHGVVGHNFQSTGDHNIGDVLLRLDVGTACNSFYHLIQPNIDQSARVTVQDLGAGSDVSTPVTISKSVVHAYTQLSVFTVSPRKDSCTVFADRDAVWSVGDSSVSWLQGDPPNIVYSSTTLTSGRTVTLNGKTGNTAQSYGWPVVTVTRSSGGSTLAVVDSVGALLLKSIATGQWAEFRYDSANSWMETKFGSL
jgi:hypothetical protein